LYDKSIGRMVTKFTVMFMLSDEHEDEVYKIVGAPDEGSAKVYRDNLRQAVMDDDTDFAHEMLNAGVPAGAPIIDPLEHCYVESGYGGVLSDIRDIFHAQLRAVMRIHGN
jgi:hypothetical protein